MILEYSYQFERRANKVIFMKFYIVILYKNQRNFLTFSIGLNNFIITIKKEKKNFEKKITTKFFLKEISDKTKISKDLKKTLLAL